MELSNASAMIDGKDVVGTRYAMMRICRQSKFPGPKSKHQIYPSATSNGLLNFPPCQPAVSCAHFYTSPFNGTVPELSCDGSHSVNPYLGCLRRRHCPRGCNIFHFRLPLSDSQGTIGYRDHSLHLHTHLTTCHRPTSPSRRGLGLVYHLLKTWHQERLGHSEPS